MGSSWPRDDEENVPMNSEEEIGPPPAKILREDGDRIGAVTGLTGPFTSSETVCPNSLLFSPCSAATTLEEQGKQIEPEPSRIDLEDLHSKLDEENKDKYKCRLCVKKPCYFEKLYEIHEHLQEFHIVPNNEEAIAEQIILPLEAQPQPSYPSTRELLGEIPEEERELIEPMTFHPTYEEFKDLKSYCKKLESSGAVKAGICKIVVPPEWEPRAAGYNPSDIEHIIAGPVRQNISHSKVEGAFKTIADRSVPSINIEQYMKLATDEKYMTPPHHSYDELEKLYWKENMDEKKQAPIYGADVEGSITDPQVDVWNIKRLDSILTDVLDEQIPGVNTPYLYFGMWKATFSWHVEDMDLYAVNYLHYGAPKTWYGIPPSEGHKLEQVARKLFPDMAKTCFNLMRHKCLMISPELLRANGVRVNKLVQEQRNMIIAFPHAYHSGFNHGFNMAESTNFAIDRWVDYGMRFRDCLCRGNEDEVSIGLDPFVQRFQPDRYEAWKENGAFDLHPEDPWYIRRCYKDGQLRFDRGEITEAEFKYLKKELRRKRQIPFWFKQKFDVDYYDDIRCNDVDMTDCIDHLVQDDDPELEDKLEKAKLDLVRKTKKVEIKIKPLKKATAKIYLMEMEAYNEMRNDLSAEAKERKKQASLGYSKGNSGQALGGGQARGVGFKNVDQDDLLEKRSKVICRAKKNHRFKACSKCSGCKKENCGECTYCLDMPRFGGSGLLKQKCETRICINPLLRTCEHYNFIFRRGFFVFSGYIMGSKDDAGLFGWRNWRIPDEFTAIKRDRTPASATSGRYNRQQDLSDDNNPGKDALFLGDAYNPVRHPELSIAWTLLKYWQPFYKSIFTDLGAHVMSNQGGICGDFEMKALECIEYYGAKQGITACKDWYDDFIECSTGAKQHLRMRAMFKKRHIDNHLEYLQGKRTWDETYEKPPKYNAYLEPWYDEKYAHAEIPMSC